MGNHLPDDGVGMTAKEIEDFRLAEEAVKADEAKIVAYGDAIYDLAREDTKYLKNKNIYSRWNDNQRLRWIDRITADAEAGKDTIGAHVVTRVVMNRLKG